MKRLLVFVFAVTLLGSCSKTGSENSVPNNLVGHWLNEANYSTNTGTGPSDQIMIIHSNGVCSIVCSEDRDYIGSITVDDNLITFSGHRAYNEYEVGITWSYSISGNSLELETLINGTGFNSSYGGTFEKQ